MTQTRNTQQVYLTLPAVDWDEMQAEAARLDRSLSWLVQRVWLLARPVLRQWPGTPSTDEVRP